jgi:hypothetical protein
LQEPIEEDIAYLNNQQINQQGRQRRNEIVSILAD